MAILLPATGIPEASIFPDIWLEGRLDADDEVDDNGILDTGDGTADPEAVVEFFGLYKDKNINNIYYYVNRNSIDYSDIKNSLDNYNTNIIHLAIDPGRDVPPPGSATLAPVKLCLVRGLLKSCSDTFLKFCA